MENKWELTSEAFEQFLAWLDTDRAQAALQYESIRHNLIVMFQCRRCSAAEELADETINRVIRQIPRISEIYQGDPLRYFHAVARNLTFEYHRKESRLEPLPEDLNTLPHESPPPDIEEPDAEVLDDCLEKCLAELLPEDHALVMAYYQENYGEKVRHRREMADNKGIKPSALRLRAFRIRTVLEECLRKCSRAKKNP